MFVVLVFLCGAEVGGCGSSRAVTPVVPGLPKCIKLNDWQWLKPHGAWGKLPGLGLTSADPPSLSAFTTPFEAFWKGYLFFVFFFLFILAHGTRVTREDGTGKPFLHPVRQDSTRWFPCERLSPTPVMFVNMVLNTRRVMFSSSKAAICVRDVGFNSASARQADFSLSGFPSVLQVLALLVSR